MWPPRQEKVLSARPRWCCASSLEKLEPVCVANKKGQPSNYCWLPRHARDLFVGWNRSVYYTVVIISTTVLLATVVVESSRVFCGIDSSAWRWHRCTHAPCGMLKVLPTIMATNLIGKGQRVAKATNFEKLLDLQTHKEHASDCPQNFHTKLETSWMRGTHSDFSSDFQTLFKIVLFMWDLCQPDFWLVSVATWFGSHHVFFI